MRAGTPGATSLSPSPVMSAGRRRSSPRTSASFPPSTTPELRSTNPLEREGGCADLTWVGCEPDHGRPTTVDAGTRGCGPEGQPAVEASSSYCEAGFATCPSL